MRLNIEKLRIGIVALAVLLIATILLFFGAARYARHRLAHDLPEKLGFQIQSSAQGFTFSKSDKGRTLFTLHASKVVQYKGGGRATLHDVSITLYGKQGTRADRIHGADFEYDPANGIARADGDVELDIQAPESVVSGTAPATQQVDPEKSTIHVKTSGLVFDRNSGVASTPNAVEFHFPQASGKAVGANYDSEKGLLVLNKAVELNSSFNGDNFVLRSSHAEFVRDSHQAFLLNVITEYAQSRGAAEQVIFYFRPDGSAEHLDAKGNIRISSDDGRELTAQNGSVQLDQKSQPKIVNFGGGVLFRAEEDQHRVRGTAVEGTIEFGEKGMLRHAQMRNAVTFIDQQLTLTDDSNGSATRQIRATQIDMDFTTDGSGRTSPQKVLAAGDAAVVLHAIRSNAAPQNTTLLADTLLANIGPGMGLDTLDGKGHTSLMNTAADGSTETSTGDTLFVKFDQSASKMTSKKRAPKDTNSKGVQGKALSPGRVEIQSALQQGSVTVTQEGALPAGQSVRPAPMVATAQRALYTGSDQLLHLDGAPRLADGNLEITAQVFELTRTTGDAVAKGDVKSTYQQSGVATPIVFGGQGPVHIVAQQANLLHASGDAVFRGQARLWQGTNSVAAPVIELSRKQQTLKAHGDGASNQATVNAAFLSPSSNGHAQGMVRLASQQLLYSDAERKAVFQGSVAVQDANGMIHADQAEVVLTPSPAPGQKSGGVQTQVDHLTASGHVTLEQAGRKGSGTRLVYTTASGLFVLSGSSAAPPRLVDPQHGTVTGDALIFNSHDDSVSVSGGRSGAVTETRVPR